MQRRNTVLPTLGMLLACFTAQPVFALPTGSAGATWPAPVTQFIQRSETCQHFAGEFNGDHSARDAEVNHRMDQLRCNSLHHDLQTLRKRYRTDARVSTRLDAFDDDGMPIDADAGN